MYVAALKADRQQKMIWLINRIAKHIDDKIFTLTETRPSEN